MDAFPALLAELRAAEEAGDDPRRLRALAEIEASLGLQFAEPRRPGALMPPHPYRGFH